MGKSFAAGTDLAGNIVSGTFSATGQSPWFVAKSGANFNIACGGTWVGTVTIEKAFDAITAIPVSRDALGTAASFTAPFSILVQEPEPGVLYRLNCTAFTSGSVVYRISQA